MQIFRNRAPSFQRLWNKLPILSKHNLNRYGLPHFITKWLLKQVQVCLFSVAILLDQRKKLRTCRPFLKEKNRPLTLKGDQGIIGKELKCEDFPATHGHLKVRLHHLIWKKNERKKKWSYRSASSKDIFAGVHVTSLFFVVCHQIYKIPRTCSNERGFRSSNNSEKAEKTVLIYKGQFSSIEYF